MTRLLRAEVLKLRTTRVLAQYLVAALLLPAAMAGVIVHQADLGRRNTPQEGFRTPGVVVRSSQSAERQAKRRALSAWSVAALLVAALGILVGAGEQQRGTLAALLLAEPRRRRVVVGKALACAALGLVLAALAAAGGLLVAVLALHDRGVAVSLSGGRLLGLLAGGAGACVLAGPVGVATGVLLRSVAAGIALEVALLGVIEPILVQRMPGLARFSPGRVVDGLLGGWPLSGAEHARVLEPAAALGVAVLGTVLLLILAARSLEAREVR